MMRTLLGALQFLTILPIPGSTAAPGQCAGWFPFVGILLGLCGWVVYFLAAHILPQSIAALLAVAFWVFATGGLHEDGLADSADAFRAGRSPARILAILKDSRIGTFGGLAIGLSLLLRWQAVERLPITAWTAFVASQTLPRAGIVLMAYITRPATRGLGGAFSLYLSFPQVAAALATVLAVLALLPLPFALLLTACNLLLLNGMRRYFEYRIGGVVGDCLGAFGQLSEILTLLLFLCPLSPLSATLSRN